jgi:GT2 family glycosyltransferase
MRAGVWREVGELDEQFPLFFNDADWFRRFHAMSKWDCLYGPFHTCYHVHGMSTGRRPFRQVLEVFDGDVSLLQETWSSSDVLSCLS